jgi:hypothetical protein
MRDASDARRHGATQLKLAASSMLPSSDTADHPRRIFDASK